MKPNYGSGKGCPQISTAHYGDSERSSLQIALEAKRGKITSPRERKHIRKRGKPGDICDKNESALNGRISFYNSTEQRERVNENNIRDDIKNSAYLKLVNLVNKDVGVAAKRLIESCSYSCSTIRKDRSKNVLKHNYGTIHREPYLGLLSKAESSAARKYRKKLNRKKGELSAGLDTKHIQSSPCTCTSKLNGVSKGVSSLTKNDQEKENESYPSIVEENYAKNLFYTKLIHSKPLNSVQENKIRDQILKEKRKIVSMHRNKTENNNINEPESKSKERIYRNKFGQFSVLEHRSSTTQSSLNELNVANIVVNQRAMRNNITEQLPITNIKNHGRQKNDINEKNTLRLPVKLKTVPHKKILRRSSLSLRSLGSNSKRISNYSLNKTKIILPAHKNVHKSCREQKEIKANNVRAIGETTCNNLITKQSKSDKQSIILGQSDSRRDVKPNNNSEAKKIHGNVFTNALNLCVYSFKLARDKIKNNGTKKSDANIPEFKETKCNYSSKSPQIQKIATCNIDKKSYTSFVTNNPNITSKRKRKDWHYYNTAVHENGLPIYSMSSHITKVSKNFSQKTLRCGGDFDFELNHNSMNRERVKLSDHRRRIIVEEDKSILNLNQDQKSSSSKKSVVSIASAVKPLLNKLYCRFLNLQKKKQDDESHKEAKLKCFTVARAEITNTNYFKNHSTYESNKLSSPKSNNYGRSQNVEGQRSQQFKIDKNMFSSLQAVKKRSLSSYQYQQNIYNNFELPLHLVCKRRSTDRHLNRDQEILNIKKQFIINEVDAANLKLVQSERMTFNKSEHGRSLNKHDYTTSTKGNKNPNIRLLIDKKDIKPGKRISKRFLKYSQTEQSKCFPDSTEMKRRNDVLQKRYIDIFNACLSAQNVEHTTKGKFIHSSLSKRLIEEDEIISYLRSTNSRFVTKNHSKKIRGSSLTGITPYLRRCYDTYKVTTEPQLCQELKPIVRVIKRHVPDPKLKTKIKQGKRTVDHYECYPGICKPELLECRARDCYRKMHPTKTKSVAPEKPKMKTRYASPCDYKFKPCQPKFPKVKHKSTAKKESCVVKEPRFKPLTNPFRQAVRVSSSFTFNIEFYKDKLPPVLLPPPEMIAPPPPPPPPPPPKLPKPLCKNCQSPKLWNREVCGLGLCKNRPIQTKIVYQPIKDVGVLARRCFCTKAIAKMERSTATKFTVHDVATNNTGKECVPGECKPGMCDPEKCNPKVCLRHRIAAFADKRLLDKQWRDVDMQCGGDLGNKGKGKPPSPLLPPPQPVKQKNRQSIQLGSKFLFDIEFFKDRFTGPRCPDKKYGLKPMDCIPNKQAKEDAGVTNVRKEKKYETLPLLQRCFCSHKADCEFVNFVSVPPPQFLVGYKEKGNENKINRSQSRDTYSKDNLFSGGLRATIPIRPMYFSVGSTHEKLERNDKMDNSRRLPLKINVRHKNSFRRVSYSKLNRTHSYKKMETIYPYTPKKFTDKTVSQAFFDKQGNYFGKDFLCYPCFADPFISPERIMTKNRRRLIKNTDEFSKKGKVYKSKQQALSLSNDYKSNYSKRNFIGCFGRVKQVFRRDRNSKTSTVHCTAEHIACYKKEKRRGQIGKENKIHRNPVDNVLEKSTVHNSKKRKHGILKITENEGRARDAISVPKRANNSKVVKVLDRNKKKYVDKKKVPKHCRPGDEVYKSIKFNKSIKTPYRHQPIVCSYLHTHYKNDNLIKDSLSPYASRTPVLVYAVETPKAPDKAPAKTPEKSPAAGAGKGKAAASGPEKKICRCRTDKETTWPCLETLQDDEDDYGEKDAEWFKKNPPLFEMKVQTSDLGILNTSEIFDKIYKLKSKKDQDVLITKKMLERLHGKACRCCVCQSLKKKEKMALERLEREGTFIPKPGYFGKFPCICGSKPCAAAAEKSNLDKIREELTETMVTKAPCVCGTKICAKEAQKSFLKRKGLTKKDRRKIIKREKEIIQEKKRKIKEEKAKIVAERKALEKIERDKRIIARRKHEEKMHKFHKKQLKKLEKKKKTNDAALVCDSVADVTIFGFTRIFNCGRTIVKGIRRPVETFNRLREPGAMKLGCATLGERIACRIRAMRTYKYFRLLMRSTKMGNYVCNIFICDPRRKLKKLKRPITKRRKRKQKVPLDFGCNLYMGSLRKKPFWWLWYACPWFYPHIISMIRIWRHCVSIVLFLLAVIVWSPCILCMECCRALMCCTMCTA